MTKTLLLTAALITMTADAAITSQWPTDNHVATPLIQNCTNGPTGPATGSDLNNHYSVYAPDPDGKNSDIDDNVPGLNSASNAVNSFSSVGQSIQSYCYRPPQAPSPVPEPACLVLIGVGLVSLGVLRLRG